ncbi:MAG: GtrA family protein, partial [Kiloniellales bacterium]
VAFAALATALNVGVQALAFAAYRGPLALPAAVAAGTGVGLDVKYLLDKRWIFDDRETGIARHRRKFALYSASGVLTTLVFWCTELGFAQLGDGDHLKFLGATIGLAGGYAMKYRLDRRFVFGGAA